jgi:hypothetical protein
MTKTTFVSDRLIWRIDWVVSTFFEQVLLAELKVMAQRWDVALGWSVTNVQADGRGLATIILNEDETFQVYRLNEPQGQAAQDCVHIFRRSITA